MRIVRTTMSQPKKLLLALVLAVIFGLCLHPFSDLWWLKAINTNLVQPVGQIFLRLIFMVVVPLICSALIIATCELGSSRSLGSIAKKILLYTLFISTLSVIIGISLVNVIRPGAGFVISLNEQQIISQNANTIAKIGENASAAKPASAAFIDLLPKNPLESALHALDGELVPLMIFVLIFGIALSLVLRQTDKKNILIPILEQIYDVCMKVIGFAMALAPFGVFALVFNTIFRVGHGILLSLLFYVLTVLFALLIQQFVVYSAALKYIAKRNPWQFFAACKEVYLYAFSTSSSNATLPKTLETAETKLGIPSDVSRFVLTVGATANQNGTAIFEGITVLFLAQVYGVELSIAQQVNVVLFSILAGVGTAGVPGGSLPLIMVLLQSVGIPAEGIGLILGVDRFLDMCRTTVNVSGDLVIAALVAPRAEKKAILVQS
jgi:DAACS family dicarboxylate/amino acid:cation (Na+ or H+) symporter